MLRWFWYFVPWATVLLLVVGYYHHSRSADELAAIEAEGGAQVNKAAAALSQGLQRAVSDVLVLSTGALLASYVESGARVEQQSALAEDWLAVLMIKQTYDQIRYLDETGRERLRVNYNNGQPSVVPSAKLQDKADRPYFQHTRALSRGEFYLSPLDLNIEGKAIELPAKPVIRIALPMFDQRGQRRGVLVVNYLANDLLFRLKADTAASSTRLMLFNAAGYWLYGAARGDAWAFMYNRPLTLDLRYPGVWGQMLASDRGHRRDRHGVWNWATVNPLQEAEAISGRHNALFETSRPPAEPSAAFWKVASLLDQTRLSEIRRQRLESTLAVSLAGLVLLLLAAWRMAVARQEQEKAEQGLRRLNLTLEAQVVERTKRLQNEIFDRQMAERRYRESSEQYQHMVAATVDGYWLLDDRCGFLDANQAACEMLGVSRDALLSLTMVDFDADGSKLEGQLAGLMLTGAERFESRLRRLDGTVIDVEVSASYLPDYLRFIAFVRDISERKRNERERRLAAMVMSNADEAIFVVSAEGYVLSANPAFSRVTGIAAASVVGEHADRLGLSSADGLQPFSKLLAGKSNWRAEMRGRRKTGEVYPVWFSATEVRDADGNITHYVCVFSDITEIKESQARLDFLAHHDTLTGLPNRLLFRARLEHSVERASRAQSRIAVMFIDLDHFKEVNDTLGHAVGDQLLIDLARAMTGCLRGEDTLARLGGDEFVVLLEQVVGDESVDTVLEKFAQIYPWTVIGEGHRLEVTASIGVAIFPDNASDADALVMQADAAMYRAKENGRNRACYA